MNLESQVCSLELAKQLKELGVKQESQFYFVNVNPILLERLLHNKITLIAHKSQCNETSPDSLPAYTVAELGEMLSNKYNEWSQGYHDCYSQWFFQVGHRGAGSMIEGIGLKGFSDQEHEANARAEMIIWLIENGHMKV